ncbi:MAG: ABC transporter ATP-binding protein [Deltaproteobacteria bacterium]|nr:ABC transporter ATP-binding protein [Deltaproteobacteria bacterium]
MEVIAKDLSMQFNDAGRIIDVFHKLNFAVKTGETWAILGASGVGKTTLLYILGTLEAPTSGEIILGGVNITDKQKKREDLSLFRGKYIGFVFQFHQLLAEFDALENVAMPLLLQGMSKKEAEERAKYLLNRVGLSSRLTHRPGALSGGEQQRVALARAIAPRPGLILADEPTGNLDRKIGAQITELLVEMNKEEGSSLIIVTHSLDVAKEMENIVELTSNGIVPCKLE